MAYKPDTNKHKYGTQEFRDQRAQDFANQKISSAKDFNFDQYNRKGTEGTHISRAEIKGLIENNRGEGGRQRFDQNLNALREQKEAGATFGKMAEAKYQQMEKRRSNIDAAQADMTKIENLPAGMDPADPDVRKAFRGKGWGKGDQERYEKIIAAKEKAKAAGGGQEIGKPGLAPGGSEDVGNPQNTQTQNVNQDNDINTNVNGNNNYIHNEQDNSIRQYGGDNRNFVYNAGSGGNKYTDTPASMATLAGFFAPDDSHSANAARLDRQQTMNADAQKKYGNTSHIAQGAINRAAQNSYIDPKALDQRIRGREQNSYDRAALMSKDLWGDLGNMTFTWNSNKPAEKVEQPDFEKMKDTYTDF